MSIESLLCSIRLQVFEHEAKKVIAKDPNVFTFYVWEKPISKGWKQHISIYKGGEFIFDKTFNKNVDYQAMVNWIISTYENEIKFIENCSSISFSGGGIYYPNTLDIKDIVHNFSPQAKCVYRKFKKLKTSKKELLKYMGYILNKKPNYNKNDRVHN